MAKEKEKIIGQSEFFHDKVTHKKMTSIEDALSNYDSFVKEHESRTLNVLEPAFTDMYNVFDSKSKEWGLKDEDKLTGKNIQDYKDVMVDSLKELFGKIEPAVLDGLKKVPENEHYDFLVKQYDLITDSKDGQGLSGLEHAIGKGKIKMKHLRNMMVAQKSKGHQKVHQKAIRKYLTAKLSPYESLELGKYFSKKIDKADLEIDDHTNYSAMKTEEFAGLHTALKTGDWGEQGYKGFNLKKKKETPIEETYRAA